jgi:ribosomal-protein-serine acetyltransferase
MEACKINNLKRCYVKIFPLTIELNLELRLLTLADSDTQFTLLDQNRQYIGKWLPWVNTATKQEQRDFLLTGLNRYETEGGFACGIWYKPQSENILIGIITAATIETGLLEMSYWLSESYTGKGIMFRCMQKLVITLLAMDKISQIDLVIASPNTASRSLATRLGFQESSILPNDLKLDAQLIDRIIYTLSKA